MHPELFTVPFIHRAIYSYGVLMVIGFLVAVQLAQFLARRARFNPEIFVNVGLIGLLTGIVGARLSHVIENWPDYSRADFSFTQNLWNAVNVSSGGLTYYGGFLLGFPCCILYGIYKKVPLKVGMDIIAPCLMIGLGFGRVGCFLNGCCYGAACDLPWAVQYPYGSEPYISEGRAGILKQPVPIALQASPGIDPQPISKQVAEKKGVPESTIGMLHSNSLHPAQLYSTITAFFIAAICVAMFTIRHVDGRIFAMMCMLEGPTRYILEMLRAEPAQVGSMTLSEFIGVIVFVMGVVLWVAFGFRKSMSQGGQPSDIAFT